MPIDAGATAAGGTTMREARMMRSNLTSRTMRIVRKKALCSPLSLIARMIWSNGTVVRKSMVNHPLRYFSAILRLS